MQEILNFIFEYFVSFDTIQINDTIDSIVDTLKNTQETVTATDISLENTPEPNKFLTVLDIVMKGGWLMVPLLLLSIYSIYVFVERYLTIKKASSIDPEFMLNMRDYLYNGNMNAAKNLCRNTVSPIAKMIDKGFQLVTIGSDRKYMTSASKEALGKLKKNTKKDSNKGY